MINIGHFKVLICTKTSSKSDFHQIQDGRHSIGEWDKPTFWAKNRVFNPFEPLTPHQLYEIKVETYKYNGQNSVEAKSVKLMTTYLPAISKTAAVSYGVGAKCQTLNRNAKFGISSFCNQE